MGTGKSSVGQLVATQLHFDFIDTDDLIEKRAGKSIPRIFAEDGENAFRELERFIVEGLRTRARTVIATGGGLVVDPVNLESLKTHARVICLWASPETIWTRVRHQTHRPLLQSSDPELAIRKLLAERGPFYRQADALVGTDLRSVRDVAQHVIHQFHLTSGSAHR
jgi:shikimate kinase